MQREDFSLCHQLRVRWSEVDMQGIVFNGHYLTYADIGITEYFRALTASGGGDTGAKGGDFFAVRTLLEYRSPAENDDLLDVHVRIARLGNSSMLFVIGIYRDDTLLLTGEITYVYADQQTRRPKPIPATFREAVKGYERTAPEDAAK
ncbi:acyl-CoA thioester hydrolase [Halopseudomonas xinjiangensis]|uniref:Acyl-CoA thioester hydrolase n=1 Tax=Halopseudomonas xinjiangensis TaxID=487184 RepID=A0A1H1XF01_9GAMM|nr:thioesterase family protein [Halopseudomonas xinjiangensis]SDT07711.1 acyl-CoA thioester hydrolase [Halopseudomonas xinjiangensis]